MSKITGELNAEMMKACAATNPQELERQIMYSIVPKNEREHWAAREIKHLRNRLENERATVEAFQKVIQQADEDIGVLRRQRDELQADAQRYRWLRIHGLQRAWVSLGTDCDGQNFVSLRCEFKVPEPPNLPYEDDEALEWADKDFDAAIDAAIAAARKEQK